MDVFVQEEWRENYRIWRDYKRHMICSLVCMSCPHKYVLIRHLVNGKAKRTNICPVPCKRSLFVQILVRHRVNGAFVGFSDWKGNPSLTFESIALNLNRTLR